VTDRHTHPPEVMPPPEGPSNPPGPRSRRLRRRTSRSRCARSRGPAAPGVEPISKHAPRFRLILGALIGVSVGAIGATLVLVSGQGPSTSSGNWSQWKPASSSLNDGAQQIADHVAPSYRQQGGDQLVGVTGGPLKIQTAPEPLPAKIAVASQDTAKIGIVRGSTALYSLCGLGSRCAITAARRRRSDSCCSSGRRWSSRCTPSSTST